MSSRLADPPRRLVVDSGPFIAHLRDDDPDHSAANRGFGMLADVRSRLLVPAPVVLEVFKWSLYRAGPQKARAVLARVRRGCEVLPLDRAAFNAACSLVDQLPSWGGTLEDATVVMAALELNVPVWTLNYRDFSAFRKIELWVPR